MEQVVDHIVSWLKSYSENSGTKGFVVGVSGGIDSAVTSYLCALTGKPTICVEMSIHQAESQENRASLHIDALQEKFAHVSRENMDLTSTYDHIRGILPSYDNDDLALVNTRARLRMTTLYYVATSKGMLVAGTGNKVEDFGIGFYTKYGDGGVDLSPIADLTKTEVYSVAKVLGVISQIQIAPPTDGLWGDDRTDEDQIGASYPELEWAMEKYDAGESAESFEGRQLEVFQIYARLHKANQHKMLPIPVCEIPDRIK